MRRILFKKKQKRMSDELKASQKSLGKCQIRPSIASVNVSLSPERETWSYLGHLSQDTFTQFQPDTRCQAGRSVPPLGEAASVESRV